MQIERLAQKIAKGDKKSFEELYIMLSHTVFAVCLGIVRNRGKAEEITQDTFVSVWKNIGNYGGKGFKSWILAIARNKSFNAARLERREINFDFTENESVGGIYLIDEKSEMRSVLDAALKILSDEERGIVLMRASGMKAKEVAELMQIPRDRFMEVY